MNPDGNLLILLFIITRLPALMDASARALAVIVALLYPDDVRRVEARHVIRTIAEPAQRDLSGRRRKKALHPE